jgi:hypothetical protein
LRLYFGGAAYDFGRGNNYAALLRKFAAKSRRLHGHFVETAECGREEASLGRWSWEMLRKMFHSAHIFAERGLFAADVSQKGPDEENEKANGFLSKVWGCTHDDSVSCFVLLTADPFW